MNTRFRALAVATLIGMLGIAAVSAAAVSRRDAARLQAKIDKINKNGVGARGATPVRTPVTEVELNSYLQYELGDRLPTGVKEPTVSFLGDGRLTGRAVVDLGQVGQSRKSSGMLDPFSYLTGSLPLAVNGMLRTKNGVGTFSVESASISGVPMPAWMLQEVVSYYSKSSGIPQGVTIEKPFSLPSGIREIQFDRGQAIIVQ